MVKKLVNCSEEYWEFVRELRNNPEVASGFIQTSHITAAQQFKYMFNNSQYYRVCTVDGKPAGYIGVIEDDIRVCTHPDFQKLGVAEFMVNEMMKIFPTAFAKIKLDNIASIKLFEKCGFKRKFYLYEKD